MMVLEGQGSDYHGPAVSPANLSLFELALGYHKVREEWHCQHQGMLRGATHVRAIV